MTTPQQWADFFFEVATDKTATGEYLYVALSLKTRDLCIGKDEKQAWLDINQACYLVKRKLGAKDKEEFDKFYNGNLQQIVKNIYTVREEVTA